MGDGWYDVGSEDWKPVRRRSNAIVDPQFSFNAEWEDDTSPSTSKGYQTIPSLTDSRYRA